MSKYCHFKHILCLIVHDESFKMSPKVNVSSDLHLPLANTPSQIPSVQSSRTDRNHEFKNESVVSPPDIFCWFQGHKHIPRDRDPTWIPLLGGDIATSSVFSDYCRVDTTICTLLCRSGQRLTSGPWGHVTRDTWHNLQKLFRKLRLFSIFLTSIQ